MTRHAIDTTDSTEGDGQLVTNPEALAERDGVAFERRMYDHDDPEHCETDTAGRAIVGITNPAGHVLVLVQPTADRAILPNETVDPGEDWATIGRGRVEGMSGIGVTLDDVRCVREVEHRVDGERRSRTHHVVFGGSLADPDAPFDGLCEDNPWELRWIDAMPNWLDDDHEGVYADIERFVGSNA